MQTKFAAADNTAEANFYGIVPPETMQASQLATCTALNSSVDLASMQVGFWQQHPQASNVM